MRTAHDVEYVSRLRWVRGETTRMVHCAAHICTLVLYSFWMYDPFKSARRIRTERHGGQRFKSSHTKVLECDSPPLSCICQGIACKCTTMVKGPSASILAWAEYLGVAGAPACDRRSGCYLETAWGAHQVARVPTLSIAQHCKVANLGQMKGMRPCLYMPYICSACGRALGDLASDGACACAAATRQDSQRPRCEDMEGP